MNETYIANDWQVVRNMTDQMTKDIGTQVVLYADNADRIMTDTVYQGCFVAFCPSGARGALAHMASLGYATRK